MPEIHSTNGMIRQAAERLAINTPLQGTAADLIKLSMIEIDRIIQKEALQGYMILQIHDELIFEVPDMEIPLFEKLVKKSMEGVFDLKVPLIVDISVGKNWGEC
jgi:DNA polymerase I